MVIELVLRHDPLDVVYDIFVRKVIENAPAYVGSMIRKLRPINKYKLARFLDCVLSKGRITEKEKEKILMTDFIGKGILKQDETKIVVTIDVFKELNTEDVKEVSEKALMLSKTVRRKVLPFVVYNKAERKALAKTQELHIVTRFVEFEKLYT